ncbi:UNVERIFIED_CONTAM: DNA repair protein XRCC4 [Sesamum radiatum]|uniref:DNA repair protein XRCC4 n=1 Tax=Sesamum radiatum TaxID=300843 RepID=A0AAW2UBV0_SESRA
MPETGNTVDGIKTEPVFVKGTWHRTRFDLSITDGLQAWTCHATEEEVKERASNWDQTVADYIDLAERYLGFQQPGSVYGFADAGNGCKRLSWTFEKEGTKLEWRWKCQPSSDSKKTTAEVLDFLMDANIRLSEEVVWKTQSFDRLKLEAEKCLAQSEKLSSEKTEFESEIYGKFVNVLNSKKAKLRDLRDRLSKQAQPTSCQERRKKSLPTGPRALMKKVTKRQKRIAVLPLKMSLVAVSLVVENGNKLVLLRFAVCVPVT